MWDTPILPYMNTLTALEDASMKPEGYEVPRNLLYKARSQRSEFTPTDLLAKPKH